MTSSPLVQLSPLYMFHTKDSTSDIWRESQMYLDLVNMNLGKKEDHLEGNRITHQ